MKAQTRSWNHWKHFPVCVSNNTRQIIAAKKTSQPQRLESGATCWVITVTTSSSYFPADYRYCRTICFCMPVKDNRLTSSTCLLLCANVNVFSLFFFPGHSDPQLFAHNFWIIQETTFYILAICQSCCKMNTELKSCQALFQAQTVFQP